MANFVRIQLDFPEDRIEELDEIMQEAGLNTRKELFNNALTLLSWALEEARDGRVIASLSKSKDSYRELVMPVLRTAARASGKNRPQPTDEAKAEPVGV